jgi:antitoxin VapB
VTLNIKDHEAHKLAQAIAQQTGETMTHAVKQALRERLERLSRHCKPETTVEELMSIGRRCAAMLKGKPVAHGEMLYDEHGLPR